mgnify:CR=1 FL=1
MKTENDKKPAVAPCGLNARLGWLTIFSGNRKNVQGYAISLNLSQLFRVFSAKFVYLRLVRDLFFRNQIMKTRILFSELLQKARIVGLRCVFFFDRTLCVFGIYHNAFHPLSNVLRVFTARSRRKNLVEQTLSRGFAPLWNFNRHMWCLASYYGEIFL